MRNIFEKNALLNKLEHIFFRNIFISKKKKMIKKQNLAIKLSFPKLSFRRSIRNKICKFIDLINARKFMWQVIRNSVGLIKKLFV